MPECPSSLKFVCINGVFVIVGFVLNGCNFRQIHQAVLEFFEKRERLAAVVHRLEDDSGVVVLAENAEIKFQMPLLGVADHPCLDFLGGQSNTVQLIDFLRKERLGLDKILLIDVRWIVRERRLIEDFLEKVVVFVGCPIRKP